MPPIPISELILLLSSSLLLYSLAKADTYHSEEHSNGMEYQRRNCFRNGGETFHVRGDRHNDIDTSAYTRQE